MLSPPLPLPLCAEPPLPLPLCAPEPVPELGEPPPTGVGDVVRVGAGGVVTRGVVTGVAATGGLPPVAGAGDVRRSDAPACVVAAGARWRTRRIRGAARSDGTAAADATATTFGGAPSNRAA